MHQFLARIARLAFGKGAAFCYAVTVGVSGQAAYDYLKPHDPAPQPVAATSGKAPAAPAEAAGNPAAAAAANPAAPPDMPPPDLPSRERAAEAARSAESPDAVVAAPIPLLPSASAEEVEKDAIPVRPGPGSGGLY